MSIVGDIASALQQAGIDAGVGPGRSLRRGWDYWQPGERAIDGKGIARTPHLVERENLPEKFRPIVDANMTACELLGGIWRHCLIRPGEDKAADKDNPFAVSSIDVDCLSAQHLVTIIGHSPRDLALYLDELRSRDPRLFKLVLAKDFRGALRHDPSEKKRPWPAAVRSKWKGIEDDYLPPFLVAVLYAELARLAVNQAGLLELSFDGCVELTTKQFLERVPTAGAAGASVAIARAIKYAPLQSLALGAPDNIALAVDRVAAKAWAETAASSIALLAGERGQINIAPKSPSAAKALQAGWKAHPHFWLEARKAKGYSRHPHRAASFWGLNWRRNAAVRLLELATTAREWNKRYRPNGPALARASTGRFTRPLAGAMSAIRFAWLAEHNSEAALTFLGEVLSSEEKKAQRFATWRADAITALTIDDHLGEKSGLTLLKQAEDEFARLPGPGDFGYTARSQAHLWLDDAGDDIAHYRRFQDDALHKHAASVRGELPVALRNVERVPPNVIALLGRQYGIKPEHGGIGHNQPPSNEKPSDPAAACGTQQLGQMISPLSTDPIIAMLVRLKMPLS